MSLSQEFDQFSKFQICSQQSNINENDIDKTQQDDGKNSIPNLKRKVITPLKSGDNLDNEQEYQTKKKIKQQNTIAYYDSQQTVSKQEQFRESEMEQIKFTSQKQKIHYSFPIYQEKEIYFQSKNYLNNLVELPDNSDEDCESTSSKVNNDTNGCFSDLLDIIKQNIRQREFQAEIDKINIEMQLNGSNQNSKYENKQQGKGNNEKSLNLNKTCDSTQESTCANSVKSSKHNQENQEINNQTINE